MIRHFRRLRQRLLSENRFTRYLAYAAGEIVLVVAGILIALQINNWNDARKDRAQELGYLANIRADMVANIAEMDRTLAERNGRIAAAKRILAHFDGQPIDDPSAFNADGINIYNWERYYQGNNTYQELVNSGNFALLSNNTIKNMLLDIELQYTKMKSEEDHYRFDTETALYRPIYAVMDTEPLTADFEYRASDGKAGMKGALTPQTFDAFLKNRTIKNGFVMTIIEYEEMNEQMQQMRALSEKLIKAIDVEMKQ